MSSDSTVPPGGTTAPVSGVYVKIYGEIMADKTLLPTMPEVAVRMRAAMNDPKYDVGAIARIVQADAGVPPSRAHGQQRAGCSAAMRRARMCRPP
jgi:hypothetical protein